MKFLNKINKCQHNIKKTKNYNNRKYQSFTCVKCGFEQIKQKEIKNADK